MTNEVRMVIIYGVRDDTSAIITLEANIIASESVKGVESYFRQNHLAILANHNHTKGTLYGYILVSPPEMNGKLLPNDIQTEDELREYFRESFNLEMQTIETLNTGEQRKN